MNSSLRFIAIVGVAAGLWACGGDPLAPDGVPGSDTTAAVNQPAMTPRAGYYVSPQGTSAGDGTRDNPWNLETALSGANGRVQPGDTIWLRGGTYRGTYRPSVTGAPGKPVVVRGYPGERAILDAAGSSKTTLFVLGAYTVYWGFEITNSHPVRSGGRSHGIANYASHTRYVNLVIRDAGVGFYNESDYADVEMVGCVIYNGGYQGSDRGHGHAIYLRSNTGPVTARDNIMFNHFGYGVHVFTNPGQGTLTNVRLEGNVSFNNGTLSSNSTAANILLGGDAYATGGIVRDNMTYASPGVGGENLQVGWGSLKNGTVQIVDNYAAGGETVLEVGYWSSLTAGGNRLMGTGTVLKLLDPAMSPSKFSGQTASSFPATTNVIVRSNPYEKGRAHVVVYNWGRQGSVPVDLSGIVPSGAHYEVRNVQDLFGSPVVSGTYGGGTITLPIRAVEPPTPVGMSSSRSPSTGVEFGVYLVTLRS